jgi:hypothetical protein
MSCKACLVALALPVEEVFVAVAFGTAKKSLERHVAGRTEADVLRVSTMENGPTVDKMSLELL